MVMEKYLSSRGSQYWDLIKGCLVVTAAVGGIIGIAFGAGSYIKHNKSRNLDEGSIMLSDNNTPLWSLNMPLVRNLDVDHDGKLESALFYVGSEGGIMYQEITFNGRECEFGEPRRYKRK